MSRAPQEAMAWYVWTTHRPGALEAALLPGSPESAPGAALLALRYYPDPRELLFSRFAPAEQEARLSPHFDQTGTPALERASELDPSLFHVGTLMIVPQGPHHVGLRMSAQDRWVEQSIGKAGSSVNRDVPGLELALSLLDPLVCGLSYLGRRPPATVRLWRRPGVLWRIESDGQVKSTHDPDLSEWELEHHGLVVPGRADSAGRAPPSPPPAERPLFEHSAETPPRYAPWPVNSQWWQAAGWQFDPVGVFCGRCAAEENDERMPIHHHFGRRIDDALKS
ncbi:MAG: hypothetical protein IPP91_14185 [Betaproteobacteria bacterium]|nr:hypothetical protein [Betaproteobacteria bacterium]